MIKKIWLFFLATFFITLPQAKASIDQELCTTSPSCQSYCSLKNQNKYDETNSKHGILFTRCLDDISLKQSSSTPEQLLEKLQEALEELKLNPQNKDNSQIAPKIDPTLNQLLLR